MRLKNPVIRWWKNYAISNVNQKYCHDVLNSWTLVLPIHALFFFIPLNNGESTSHHRLEYCQKASPPGWNHYFSSGHMQSVVSLWWSIDSFGNHLLFVLRYVLLGSPYIHNYIPVYNCEYIHKFLNVNLPLIYIYECVVLLKRIVTYRLPYCFYQKTTAKPFSSLRI